VPLSSEINTSAYTLRNWGRRANKIQSKQKKGNNNIRAAVSELEKRKMGALRKNQ